MSFILFFSYLLVAVLLSKILNINYLLLMLDGVIIFLVVFVPISRGIMQGKEKFKSLGIKIARFVITKIWVPIRMLYLKIRRKI